MEHSTPTDNELQPRSATLAFLKLFARNYRAVGLSDGGYAEITLS